MTEINTAETRYVTQSEADALRLKWMSLYAPPVEIVPVGVVGCHEISYYVVPDDDPRLTHES